MKIRHLVILSVIFILILSVTIFKAIRRPHIIQSQEGVVFKSNQSLDSATEIKILKKDSETVRLVKLNGEWRVMNRWQVKANQAKVKQVIESLEGLNGEFRGSGESVLTDFGLGQNQGIQIQVFQNQQELMGINVSLKLPAESGSFFSPDQDRSIYAAPVDFLRQVGFYGGDAARNLDVDFWIEKSFFNLKPIDVARMEFQKIEKGEPASIFSISKADSKVSGLTVDEWLLEGDEQFPFHIGTENVYHYLGVLRAEKADRILDPEANQLGAFKWQLNVTKPDGRMVRFQIAPVTEQQPADKLFNLLVTEGENHQLFIINDSVLKSFEANPEDFLSNSPLVEEFKAWQSVFIRTPERAVKLIKKDEDGKVSWGIDGQNGEENSEAVLSLLNRIQHLKVSRYLPELEEKKWLKFLDDNWMHIELQDDSVIQINLSSKALPSGEFPAKRDGFSLMFAVSETQYKEIIDLKI
ncbi:MAG: hypothetical protein COV74_00660 [Candidatus Omnitrophica bacterium CG11_big_fil_rev_8_21_14_0_20_45_26]|uniref:DUF4340 domain-containing protein n=1 Tax=Candidatus Abzuiibacterium crystallinum TaxID=1974748 RepID=A0A2H0LSR7_9BACT|nr:MAG: hypothetical protein COV74_00660 [Candidatus Omnitrophica bacterium CG11_big_fil_rev_8_21_14_0_20_45_26]PIW64198.1 MAG: hypothetical protein COW12_07175 [Candidatus Omnitrophica bacterium CG12_big_fil_rev_8_21_14_0_65_45_16]